MADNKDLLSDEELLESKELLSEDELQKILGGKFTFILPPAKEITVTVAEIEEALGNKELEKILLNKNLSELRRDELISEQISKYLAYRLGLPIENVREISGEKEAKELVQKAMSTYLEEYIDYDTFFGKISIQRQDKSLLMKCYVNAVLAMIYMIFVNFFPEICVGNNLAFYIGTFINVLMLINMFKLSFRIWGLTIR